MPHFQNRSPVFMGLLVPFVLGGCEPKVECDSPETRNEVLKIVSSDHSDALAGYAAKKSDVAGEIAKSGNSERAKPTYLLGDKMVTTSMSADKRTLTCSGSISAIVGDTKASKEVNFTVQRPSDGKISVSVVPFQFEVPAGDSSKRDQ